MSRKKNREQRSFVSNLQLAQRNRESVLTTLSSIGKTAGIAKRKASTKAVNIYKLPPQEHNNARESQSGNFSPINFIGLLAIAQ
jgi:hypothetical protein